MKKEFPKKWAYKLEEGTQERFKQILQKIGHENYWNVNGVGAYYMVNNDKPEECYDVLEKDYTPVTLQELQDHYLPKPNEVEEKKILGYKAPMDLFKGRIKAGTVFTEKSNEGFIMYNKDHKTSGIATEIVETWEPVYAVGYKVGDFVFAVNCGGNGINGKGEHLVQIADESEGQPTGLLEDWDYVVKQENNYYRVNSISAKFRKATEEEVQEWKARQLPTIKGYTGQIIDGRVEFGCVKLSKAYLQAYRYLLTSSAKAKITVHGTDITLELIDKLLKALE